MSIKCTGIYWATYYEVQEKQKMVCTVFVLQVSFNSFTQILYPPLRQVKWLVAAGGPDHHFLFQLMKVKQQQAQPHLYGHI